MTIQYRPYSLAILVFLILTDLINMNAYAQSDNSTSSETLISLGPFTFSSKIDLGILIAAAAFASTISYNIIQMRKAQQKMQDEIKANQEQIQNDKKISEAGFWFSLRDQVARYDDLESYFSPGGKWYGSAEGGPETTEEWSRVDAYMSLLSMLNALIDQEILSTEMFHKLYGPKVDYIYFSRIIRMERLEKDGDRQREFLQLCMKRGRHDQLAYNIWPPFWVSIIMRRELYVETTMQHGVEVWVKDSIKSLEKTDIHVQEAKYATVLHPDVEVQNAKVATTVLYPSGITDHFEGVTNDLGICRQSWFIKDENKLLGEGKIIVKVSKENKTSSELTERFQIKARRGDSSK